MKYSCRSTKDSANTLDIWIPSLNTQIADTIGLTPWSLSLRAIRGIIFVS